MEIRGSNPLGGTIYHHYPYWQLARHALILPYRWYNAGGIRWYNDAEGRVVSDYG